MRPTPRFLILTALGTVGALLPILVAPGLWTVWPVVLAWLLLLFGLDVVWTPAPSRVEHTLDIPECLFVGDTAEMHVRLDVRSSRSFPVGIRLDLSAEIAPQPPAISVVESGRTTAAVPLVPRRRGTSRLHNLWLRYRGPLGLVERVSVRKLDHELPIVPNVKAVRSAALRFSIDTEFRAGLQVDRFRGEGTEFDSLKEFGQGDDPRTIDWKHTARHRKLLVRQYRSERNHQVVFAIDSGRLMGEALERIPKLDHALNAMLLLSYVCVKNADRVGMISFGARVGSMIQPQSGMRAQRALAQVAAGVEYSDAETNYTLGLTTLGQRLRRRSLIVVLTDFADTITAELLLENLSRLAHRHLMVFVALRDPQLDRLTSSQPVDSLQLNRAVVAQTFLRDREVVLRRLRRMGILTIDAEPKKVGPSLINSYLEIKRREMI